MRKLTLKHCQDFAASKNGRCISLEYKNSCEKLQWKCGNGHYWFARFNSIKGQNQWCPECVGLKKHTLNDCINFAITKNGQCLAEEYINSVTKILWQCEQGHTWHATFNKIQQGKWCPYCAKNVKLNIKACQKIATDKDGKCLSIEYKNSKQKIFWQCRKEHIWQATYNNVQSGRWCPTCPSYVSKPQKEIYEYLTIHYNNLNIILNDTQTIRPFDLDLYIPSLKLAIEYDGEYWHYSDWAIKNGSLGRMKKKNELCSNNDIKLIRVRENNWLKDKQEVLQKVTSFIEALNG